MADPDAGARPVLALLPLDDRPVTRRLPAMVAAVVGAQVRTPPEELLPRFRTPGGPDGLAAWLRSTAGDADAAVVSLEMLGFGGLVPSRIGAEPVVDVLHRWQVLGQLTGPVHASCVVMRTPDADDGSEEPDYYAHAGRALHEASRALVKGAEVPRGLEVEVSQDFFGRRLRNHVLNLAALDLARLGTVRTLAVTADDTASTTVGSAEQAWVADWVRWLSLGERVLTYPGADEVGTVLTVRALREVLGQPAATVRVCSSGSLDVVPTYEADTLARSVARQVQAAGAAVTEGAGADLVLVVHPLADDGYDHATAPPPSTDPAPAAATAALVRSLLDEGHRVAVADCAHGNGADPALVAELRRVLDGRWERLAGFAGWNTAGNTVGSALAHGLAVVLGTRAGTLDEDAHATLLRHRLLEDWGWMSSARATVRAELGSDPSRHDHLEPRSAGAAGATARAGELLDARLAELGEGWRLEQVRFPWDRTYEVDLTVERT